MAAYTVEDLVFTFECSDGLVVAYQAHVRYVFGRVRDALKNGERILQVPCSKLVLLSVVNATMPFGDDFQSVVPKGTIEEMKKCFAWLKPIEPTDVTTIFSESVEQMHEME